MKQLLIASALFLCVPFFARASGPIHVSEIAWAGSSASLADEWFELCGPPGMDLSGWSIGGAASSPILLPAGSVVPDSGAFLIANYADDDVKSTLAVTPGLVTTSIALSNSNLFLLLRDADGTIVDAAGASGTPPVAGTSGETKTSMERVDAALSGGTAEAWTSSTEAIGFDAGATELGTPGSCAPAALSEPESDPKVPGTEPVPGTSPAPASPATSIRDEPMSAVRLSEIYPAPLSGEQEWVELVNPSGVGEVLDGWTIEDGAGTATPLGGTLLSWSRLVIASPKGPLNNDGDIVLLKDARGRTVDRAEYPKFRKGESLMRAEWQDAFVVTTTPTPGEANVHTSNEPDVSNTTPAEAGAHAPNDAVPSPSPALNASPLSFRPEAQPERRNPSDSEGSLGFARDDKKETGRSSVIPAKAGTQKKQKSRVARFKGLAYTATVIVPPGVYSKTRMYVLRDGSIEELRLSKSPASPWGLGDRITFMAQRRSEGAVAYLLANPNSVRTVGSASATFAAAEAWPEEAGGYRFTAEVASIRGNALEVRLGGTEGDVLAPAGTAGALKPGDTVEIEGFIEPGIRPRVLLPRPEALTLFKAFQAESPETAARVRLPWPAAIGLTVAAGMIGLAAYLRFQRLKRLALTHSPIEGGGWE